MPVPEVTPRAFCRLSAATAAGLGLLIVTGGAVRLTDSGLGCPDWPSCARTSFVGPLSFHKDVEFGNRIVSVVVTVLVVVTVVAAFRLRSARRDVRSPAVLLAAGMVTQIVLGGLVVLYHLWPPLVMVHFLVSQAMVVAGTVLFLRARRAPGSPVAVVGARVVLAVRVLLAVTAVLLAVGTAVSGAGPHGGSRSVARLPVSFRAVTEVHATIAVLLIGMVAATVALALAAGVPPPSVRRAEILLGALVTQGAIGYTQYFLQVPAGLVVFHLAGATAVAVAAVAFYDSLFARVGEGAAEFAPRDELSAAESRT